MRPAPALRAACLFLALAGCRPHAPEEPGAVPANVRQSAKQGQSWAQTRLGLAYLTGVGAPMDKAQGLLWLHKAAALHNGEAETALCRAYEDGDGVPPDAAQGLAWLKAAADDHWGWASVMLGDRYRDGLKGFKQDYAAAWAYYRKASADNNVSGDARMAYMTLRGYGVPMDKAQALRMYTDAANRDHFGWSSWVLGDAYYRGLCVRDPVQARMWLERALFQGHRDAAVDLARMAEHGQGQPKDPALALAYYRTGSYSSEPFAEREYGRVLLEGRLGPPDFAEAAKQLSAAAQASDLFAAGMLGGMLARGQGRPQDLAGAQRLWSQGLGAPGSWTWKGQPAVIARARRSPAMDGGLTAFKGLPKLRLDASKAGAHLVRDQDGPGGVLRATAQLMRDDQNLYLGVDVVQHAPPTNASAFDSDRWDGDCAELYVCSRSELTPLTRSAPSYFDYHFHLTPSSAGGTPQVDAGDHPCPGCRVSVRRTKQGYSLCAALPLAAMDGLDWKPGDLVRFDLSVAKAGKDGRRWAKVYWNATGEAVDRPDQWGEARIE